MADFASFQKAGVVYPLATSTGNSSLLDADPSLYWTMQFFASALQTHMGARLVAEAASCNLASGPNAITQAVKYQLPYDPLTVIEEQQVGKWPLLAIWRTTEKERWRTVGRMDTLDVWKVAYVLPPLTGGQRERLQPMLKAVRDILLDRIENMGDPSFQNGADPWGPGYANLEEINLLGGNTGHYELPQSNLVMPAWIGDLQVIERQENIPVAGLGGPLSGIDTTLTLVPSDGEAPIDFISMSLSFPVFTGQLGTLNSRPAWLEPGVP